MFNRRNVETSQSVPERARYTKYYEHDGQLRAYANRSMLMAGLFGVIALVSLGFAIYVRLQPVTVIRVSADGEATVVGGRPTGSTPALTRAGLLSALAAPAGEAAPTDIEGRAAVRKFLESYMRYTPTSVDKNLADALNMMTGFSVLPLQVASLIGFVFTLAGILALVYVVGRYLIQGETVPGFPFLASTIALFSGAQLFALGIMGEYLARMHFGVMQKPPYVIRTHNDSPPPFGREP